MNRHFVLIIEDYVCPKHRNELLAIILYLSDSVMLRKSVIVKDSEHQGLVKSIRIRKILELKGLIEEWIQCFSVDFCLKLFHSFCFWHQENLQKLIELIFRNVCPGTRNGQNIVIQSLMCQIDNNTILEEVSKTWQASAIIQIRAI